jgi:hypothetical protein
MTVQPLPFPKNALTFKIESLPSTFYSFFSKEIYGLVGASRYTTRSTARYFNSGNTARGGEKKNNLVGVRFFLIELIPFFFLNFNNEV